jgi:hypothetical protein
MELTLFEAEPATPVQTGPQWRGFIGHCKHCQHATRQDRGASGIGECPQHGRYYLTALHGQTSAHRCNSACMGATGPSCDCSCGGANHGAWHSR